jgi:hypothetical protein
MASRKAAAKEAEDLQGVFIQMDRPAWEGFWGYQDLKKPDYDRFSQDEPVQEAFSQEVLTQRKEHEVFNNLTACLEDLGTFEPGQLFKYGKDKVYVQMDDASEGLRMASALRRRGFAVKRMRTSGWLVKEARTRVRATKSGAYVLREGKNELGRYSTRKIAERHQEVHEFSPRKAAAPGGMTVEMPDPMAAMKTQLGPQTQITPAAKPGMLKVDVPPAKAQQLLNPAISPGAGATGLNKQVPSSTISTVEAGPKVEMTPEQYGKSLETNVDNYEGYILDNAMETKGLPIQEAWVKSWLAMKRAFPGLDQSDKKYVMRKWKSARRLNASKRTAGYVTLEVPEVVEKNAVRLLSKHLQSKVESQPGSRILVDSQDLAKAENLLKVAGYPFQKMGSRTAGPVHISPEMDKRVERLVNQVWNEIGGDCEAMPGWEGTARDIAEMVVDADRLLENGNDREAATAFYDNRRKDRKANQKWLLAMVSPYANS